MAGAKHKAKGDAYERELAAYLSDALGRTIRRSPLSGGGTSDAQMADLEGAPDLWIEAKRTERFEPRKALAQCAVGKARRHCPDLPVVINRMNREKTGDSLVVMRLDDWLNLYKAYLAHEGA